MHTSVNLLYVNNYNTLSSVLDIHGDSTMLTLIDSDGHNVLTREVTILARVVENKCARHLMIPTC